MLEDAFRRHMEAQGLASNTVSTRSSTLRRIERDEGVDLDSEFERDGMRSLIARFEYSALDHRSGRPNPSSIEIEPENLRKFLAFYKSTLNAYRRFKGAPPLGSSDEPETSVEQVVADAVENADRTFALERDLQTALRTDLSQLELGLKVADGGREARVEAGLIDILARDADDRWVVIELKADIARLGVVAQTLAYMASIEEERGGSTSGIIVAADFDRRVELAARAVQNLTLKRYSFRFSFS